MSNMVNVLSKLNIKANSAVVFQNNENYPDSPQLGQLAFIDKVLLIYTDLNSPGSPTWHPVINADVPTYTHTQGIDNTTWTINHDLNSDNLIFFVYDINNTVIFPSEINFVDLNNITLEFAEAVKGKAVIFSSDIQTGVNAGSGESSSSYNIQQFNSDFTAILNTIHSVDTTSNQVNVTMPSNPSNGDWVGFLDDKATFDTNSVNLLYDGTNQIHYEPEGLNLDAPNLNVKFVFNNNNWVLFK